MDIKENTTWKNKNSSGSVVVSKVVDDLFGKGKYIVSACCL